MSLTAVQRPWIELAWSVEDRNARIARNAAIVLAGSLLLTLSARLSLPFQPVPLTMQDFCVVLLGVALGWRLGGASVLLYLAQGAAGLPVFANGGGLPYFAGPTGGYLVGFLGAAILCGWLAERGWDRRALSTALAMALASALLLTCGSSWLARFVGVEKALAVGFLPFVPAALLKIGLATWLFPRVRRALARA